MTEPHIPNRVLIVEDERIIAADLQDTLRDLGYEVTGVVSSGEAAMLEAERLRPDIALMDIRIRGGMDSIEAARILRDRFEIPVVFLAAHADLETLDRGKPSRPLGCLVKPFQKSELQASIEIALESYHQARKSTERYQRLTDVLSAVILGIISVDDKEMVVLLNSTAENLTGWSRRDARGHPARHVFRLVDVASGLPVDLPLEDVMLRGSLTEFSDTALLSHSGQRHPVTGNIAPVRKVAGRPAGAVILFELVPPGLEAPDLKIPAKFQADSSLTFGRFHLVAASDAMKRLLAYALRVAHSDVSTVLIEGGTGTGKDLLAHFIHYSSSRRTGPFVPVNCAAIPETLLESELFGHEPGAYTDARTLKKGLFEAADGGTLFLDEIADMSLQTQAKLLRAVEEKVFRRLGGLQDIDVNVRVLAASNRELASEIESGRFRLDLYHRLSVIEIPIPPLRERPDDILPLAQHFLSLQTRKLTLSPEANVRRLAHDWPGNVRELRNLIERAGVLEDSEVIGPSSVQFTRSPAAADAAAGTAPGSRAADLLLANVEREAVERALRQTSGNQTAAARLLGITRDMLRHRMKRFGLLKPLAKGKAR